MKFAAIDIGSNAVRCMFAYVYSSKGMHFIKKESLIRVPIRLGEDSFTAHKISKDKTDKLVSAMTGFKHLITAFQSERVMACATSAMRDATNGKDIIQKIKKKTGLNIEIISGKKEAQLIYNTHAAEYIDADKSYLFVDVGGGSTELVLFANHKMVASQSFNIGTIRILKDIAQQKDWTAMQKWIKEKTKGEKSVSAIGSGGSINKSYKILYPKNDNPFITLKMLSELQQKLASYTLDERMRIFEFTPDRADVIIPALSIYMSVMQWAGIDKIYVPRLGLVDGLVNLMFEERGNY